jgi:hypothetical protein
MGGENAVQRPAASLPTPLSPVVRERKGAKGSNESFAEELRDKLISKRSARAESAAVRNGFRTAATEDAPVIARSASWMLIVLDALLLVAVGALWLSGAVVPNISLLVVRGSGWR